MHAELQARATIAMRVQNACARKCTHRRTVFFRVLAADVTPPSPARPARKKPLIKQIPRRCLSRFPQHVAPDGLRSHGFVEPTPGVQEQVVLRSPICRAQMQQLQLFGVRCCTRHRRGCLQASPSPFTRREWHQHQKRVLAATTNIIITMC